jgi:hypothetical protein
MGYQRSTLKLSFDPSTDFAGLDVEMKRLSTGATLDAISLVDNRPARGSAPETLKEYLTSVQQMVAAGLIAWNYEDHTGMPIEATADGVSTCDIEMLLAILMAWVDVAVMPSAPLEQRSPAGLPSQEVPLIPMDIHSPNQPN